MRRLLITLVTLAVIFTATSELEAQTAPIEATTDALIVLDTADTATMEEAIRVITRSGGHITHVFPTSILIGTLPPTADATLAEATSIKAIHRTAVDPTQFSEYDLTTQIGINAWNKLVLSEAQTRATANKTLPIIEGDALHRPPNLLKSLNEDSPPVNSPTRENTSGYMIGKVAVGIVLPESSGNNENWTSERRDQVASEIMAGANWWAARETRANLTFIYDVHFSVPTSYEPIQMKGAGPPSGEEHLWIGEVLATMGYPGTNYMAQAQDYVNDIRTTYQTDWAFAVFVADSLNDTDGKFSDGSYFAYAYVGGPFTVMTYDNNGYGIDNMDAVLAHEMGHIFYALDQYYDAQQICTKRSGFLNVENQNSEYGQCLSDVGSIMRGDVPPYAQGQIDYYARGQVGWWDENGNGILDPLDRLAPPDDNANFIADITLPDGTVVTPGEPLTKIWRVKNSGTSTWSDYKLVFESGDQMSAPSPVGIPYAAPGDVVDISVPIQAPSTSSRGDWRIVNRDGTWVPGGHLWVELIVEGTDPPAPGAIQILDVDYPVTVGPGQSFRPEVTVRVNEGSLLESRGDMLRNTDGNLYGAWPHVAVVGVVNAGQTYKFTFYADNPITAPEAEGTYESKWRVWRDGNWAGDEIAIRFEVSSSGGNNHRPNRPTLTGPGDWAVYYGNTGIVLTAQHNGDPDDGDTVTEYYFEIFESAQNANSGWITSNSWSPQGLGFNGYQWHAKVRDNHGNESDWSDQVWHFNVLNNDPEIYDFHSETCREAWGGPEKICFCAQTNAGTLKLMVNMASDGSDNGEWRVLNELGTPNYNCDTDEDRPPNWGQLEGESGDHLVRLYARREGGWENAAHRDITVHLPIERRPNNPPLHQPTWESYVNTLNVRFDWEESLRTTSYRLEVSPDSGFSTLFVDETLPVGTTEYDHTFDSDYETVYWRVTPSGPYGTNESLGQFHIDLDSPSSAAQALPPVTTDTKFSVNWSGSDERSGLRWYHVQTRDGSRPDSEWVDWLVNTPKTVEMFQAQPGHTYYFRVRAMDNIGNWEDWPAGDGDTYTLVDPSAAPPTNWWDENYAEKRNLVILNNDGDAIPIHYPMHVHFDDTTDPTAAEIYNASLAGIKGDDVRIVYQDQIELSRFVQRFTPSQIDIWFPLQAGLGGGQTDSGSYQIYYGNAGASAPPADVNTVFLPEADGNTVMLAHFQEGSGSTVYDSSSRSHDGNFIGAGWIDGYLGWSGLFDGATSKVDFGNHTDFNLGAMTLEAWVLVTEITGGYEHIFDKETYWLRVSGSRQPQFKAFGVQADGTCPTLELNRWYHLAATYNGSDRVRLYINGQMCNEKVESHAPYHTSAPFQMGAEHVPAPLFPGYIQHARVSNIERTDFPYARIDVEPSVEAGAPVAPPVGGVADLAVLNLTTYPNAEAGLIVQALVQNQGDRDTQNNFYTDVYLDHLPTGQGDYTGSVRFWVNSSIEANATVTQTTIITNLNGLGGMAAQGVLTPGHEVTGTLYAQVDSSGVVSETDNTNNIYLPGANICLASPDAYEGDDTFESASVIALNETQSHNFDSLADQDWVQFEAQSSITYTLRTFDLDTGADTYLYLYDIDGATLLAANDDYDGSLASRIAWQAPSTGTYYLLVQHWNPSVGGCGTSYSLSFREEEESKEFTVYLPVLMLDILPSL